jgi:hypothetical protein
VALFVDLDSVIVASIDPNFEQGSADDVILARNGRGRCSAWARPRSFASPSARMRTSSMTFAPTRKASPTAIASSSTT